LFIAIAIKDINPLLHVQLDHRGFAKVSLETPVMGEDVYEGGEDFSPLINGLQSYQ